MSKTSQVSATVSSTTKQQLDQFTEEHGLKKNYVVEQALLFFMEARRDLPDEAFIPTRIVLDDSGFQRLIEHLHEAPPPTPALQELMRDEVD